MNDFTKNILSAIGIWFFTALVVASCAENTYARPTQQKAVELVLADYFLQGVQPTYTSGFFVRNISMRSHVMAKLERDTFECVGNLVDLSTNPFQLCHPHLVVNGKAPNTLGAHTHA